MPINVHVLVRKDCYMYLIPGVKSIRLHQKAVLFIEEPRSLGQTTSKNLGPWGKQLARTEPVTYAPASQKAFNSHGPFHH